MAKKRIVMALGHNALGTNLPEQKEAAAKTSKMIADFIPGFVKCQIIPERFVDIMGFVV